MMDRDDPGDSFDPRTWGSGGEPKPAPAAAAPATRPTSEAPESTSFDPKSWVDKGEKSEPLSETAQVESDVLSDPPARARKRGLVIAAGAAGAILLVGGGAAYLMREPAPETAAPASAAATNNIAAAPGAGRRTFVVGDSSEILAALVTAGVAQPQAEAASRQAIAALGSAPGEIRLEFDMAGEGAAKQLARLHASRADGSGIILAANAEGGFAAETLAAQLSTKVHAIRGEMDETSFYSSAVTAGVTDSLISDFAAAFSFDFDFQREIHQGDVFEAAFEQTVNPQGQSIGPPKLIYVSMTTPEKSRRFYRFTPPDQAEPGWFDDNGRSTVRALMRTPVDGARVSSNFGYRTHPILGYQKLHRGTDFAAPIGTPMYAAGAGVVEVAAPRGAAGNFVVIRHDNGWQTRYMHLNRFADGLAPGVRLTQGQQIGEVGTTGRSTGPHLHYEVFIDGEPVDPLSIDTGTGVTLEGKALESFRKERDRIDLSRSQQSE